MRRGPRASRHGDIWVLAATTLLGCWSNTATPTATSKASTDYASSSAWVCRPDEPNDACHRDLTATSIEPDGSRTIVTPKIDPNPAVDCFYVYPTVDLDLVPRNHDDFRDPRIANVAVAQAARFREACSVYAPFYRQVTIGAYLQPNERLEELLAIAYADVEQAFATYLARFNRGRKIVLLGHSQGAEMVVRLLKRFFANDPSRRAQLLLAMPIGGNVEVPHGETTSSNIPVCVDPATNPNEVGCIVAYRTHLASAKINPNAKGFRRFLPRPKSDSVCVSPSTPDRKLAGAFFPLTEQSRRHLRVVDPNNDGPIKTPFLVLRNFYSASCVDGPNGYRYLAITPAANTEQRVDPIDYARDFPETGIAAPLGLHILDLQLPQADLIDLVAQRARRPTDSSSK